MNFTKLIEWSKQNYQSLPWRQNRSLYTTLVSEIMLQQTTVSTVLNHYQNFLKQFPDFTTLANANVQKLAQAWHGLGYYRRAQNLLNAAQIINQLHELKVPNDYQELLLIKGIGEYTANAIIAIGHNQPALALDGNLKRVLSRIFALTHTSEKDLKQAIYQLLENPQFFAEINKIGWRQFNEALMDLGRTICQSKKTYCQKCPVNKLCQAKDNNPLTYPKIITKKSFSINLDLLRFIHFDNNKLLCYQKQPSQWLANQWEIPTFSLTKLTDFNQYPFINKKIAKNLINIKTFITQYRITNYLQQQAPPTKWFTQIENFQYISLEDIKKQKIILSTASQKALIKIETCIV